MFLFNSTVSIFSSDPMELGILMDGWVPSVSVFSTWQGDGRRYEHPTHDQRSPLSGFIDDDAGPKRESRASGTAS